VAGQRHGEIEAQAEVGQIAGATVQRPLEVLPALEDLEDQLLVLAAVAAGQQGQALQRRRLDAAEAVTAIDREDALGGGVAQLDLVGQHVARAARRSGVELGGHDRVSPRESAAGRRKTYLRHSGSVMMICVSPALLITP